MAEEEEQKVEAVAPSATAEENVGAAAAATATSADDDKKKTPSKDDPPETGTSSNQQEETTGGTGVEVVDSPVVYHSPRGGGVAGLTRNPHATHHHGPPVLPTFKDHFTLQIPSSTIRYRNAGGAARVVEADDFQIVIEEQFRRRRKEVVKSSSSEADHDKKDDGDDDKDKDDDKKEHDHDAESDDEDEDEEEEHTFSIRRIVNRQPGVFFLRGTYAFVTVFWSGFLFVFCLQVLLYLYLNLAIELGITSRPDSSTNIGAAIGSLLSIIPFVYGLASAMVICGVFIMDMWKGHQLMRNFALSNMKTVTTEWIFFLFFLLMPLLVMCITLLAGTVDWWIITGLFWFCCILVFYLVFAINIIFYEMRACWEVTKNKYPDDDDSWYGILKRSILLRQTSSYSGRKTVRFVAMGTIYDAEFTDKGTKGRSRYFSTRSSGSDLNTRNMVQGTRSERIAIKSRLFLCSCFERHGMLKFHNTPQDPPQRMYTIEDARDVRPYITSYTWSLEKIFCRPKDSRFIAIVNGPGAITQDQIKSSMACSYIGSILVFLVLFSVLFFLRPGGAAIGFLMAAAVICALPNFKSTYRLYKTTRSFKHSNIQMARNEAELEENNNNDNNNTNKAVTKSATREDYGDKSLESMRHSERLDLPDEYPMESECVYLVTERYRISSPTPKFAWTMFWIEVCLFFVYPFISLFIVGNFPLAILFGVVCGITGMRYYINAAIVLEETGHMDLVDGDTERVKWRNQSRLNEIVGNVTRGRSLGAWAAILGTLSLVFCALFAGSLGHDQTSQQTFDTPYQYLPDFTYPQADSIRYPTCQLTNELKESPLTSMADFAFLAGLAYRGIDATQPALDGWFGEGVATDQVEEVASYRLQTGVSSQVSFKLVTHPKVSGGVDIGDFAYVLIRGTTNPWDMLTDAQLWAPAALMQTLRLLLPLGDIWTPIMPLLINAITKVESGTIAQVSFYKDTTAYTNHIKQQVENGTYIGVSVTGHSLGGGLSIITGAQSKVPAVGLSGPNTMLTRLSLDPQVEATDLDKYTFNIVPERDIVPMFDDKAQNYQFIRCSAGYGDIIGCHDSTRSLCEIIFTCGTGPRPALCECVRDFGYPEPTPTGNRTFAEACQSA